MRVVETVAHMVAERARLDATAGIIGLVPTMGYLHAGHLSLVRQARAESAVLAVSIFVNPTQFGPSEDLSRYPRDLPRDLALLEDAGVDIVFTPHAADVYPSGFLTFVSPTGPMSERLEAESRPGHFRGVATVVAKLFNVVRPHRAYFGQKDAQQVAVLRRMVADLNVPVTLRVLPTVREPDGLAMSSRNAYLSPKDRAAASVLRRALEAGRERFSAALAPEPASAAANSANVAANSADVAAILDAMRAIVAAEPRATLDYVDVCHPDTFEPLTVLTAPALLAIAARVGPARLIDNYLLRSDGTWDTGAMTA